MIILQKSNTSKEWPVFAIKIFCRENLVSKMTLSKIKGFTPKCYAN